MHPCICVCRPWGQVSIFLGNLRCAGFTQCVYQCALAYTNTGTRACVHRCALIDFIPTLCKWGETIRFKKQTQTATICCFSRTGTQQFSIIYHSHPVEAAWLESKVMTRIFWITAFMQKPPLPLFLKRWMLSSLTPCKYFFFFFKWGGYHRCLLHTYFCGYLWNCFFFCENVYEGFRLGEL